MQDASRRRVFIDGVAGPDLAAIAMVFDGSDLQIGCDVDYGSRVHHVVGEIDEVRIYRRALLQSEL